ncbi:MAG: DUF2325 domain-containing protein [Oscillospiraceae bacterium]|jgi:hypothetical protein|nr:DUF2325 domain-containing protein [Oscillospiraceae bacterium]
MSVVIIGGHDRMVCQYRDVCEKLGCNAKVFTQPKTNLNAAIGSADLIVLFTQPVSHEMAKIARRAAACRSITLAQSHSGSGNALRGILETYIASQTT